jgi:hypothetical protein
MRVAGLSRAAALVVIALGVLSACSSTSHQNVSHPNYGDLEYGTDLAACKKLHSTVVSIQGYDVQSQVTTDEPAVATCMSQRGWQTVSR